MADFRGRKALRPYNYERMHSGYGMEGRTPYECCVALGFRGSSYVGLMPVVLLDNIVLDWSRQGVPAVNDVLTNSLEVISPETTPLLYPISGAFWQGVRGEFSKNEAGRFGYTLTDG